jgi:hypothetical protein
LESVSYQKDQYQPNIYENAQQEYTSMGVNAASNIFIEKDHAIKVL